MSVARPARGHARRRLSRRLALRLANVALLVLLCGAASGVAAAATLDDYRARVKVALDNSTDLYVTLEEGETSAREATSRESQALAGIRKALPPKERVEWAGGAADVDNSWLHKELDAYAALPADAAGERSKLVSRLVERLGALSREVDEAANAPHSARDREAEKGRLQTILRRPEYNEQASRGGALARFWEWLRELLRKLLPDSKPMAPGAAGFLSVVARLFVYALAVALIVFVLWKFGPQVLNRFATRRKSKRGREARVILGEQLAPDESAADLLAEAERLARTGNLRGAIRKAYIAVLCDLGDRKLLRLARHKTNRDYLNGVRDRSELYGALRPLTFDFERHWYGFAPASDADWEQYRTLCREALQY